MVIQGPVDGLGFEEVNQSVTDTETISGTNIYGAGSVVTPKLEGTTFASTTSTITNGIITNGSITTATLTTANITTGNIYRDLSVGSSINLDYALNKGITIDNIPAEAIISGGMWVMGSAASGAAPSMVCKPAPVDTPFPLGICLTTTQSGTTTCPVVLVRGFYKGVVAEGNVAVGEQCRMGHGAAANCILASTTGSCNRAVTVMAAGSEGTAAIYLY